MTDAGNCDVEPGRQTDADRRHPDIVGPKAPLLAADLNAASATPATIPGPDAIRLLIVDDDLLSGTLHLHMAALLGHAATIETDARRAVDLALDEPFDLVLLDLGMPDLDGFATLQELRAHEAARGRAPLPVIAVTGYSSEEDRIRCRTAGFADHIAKPVQAATLKAAIERAVPRAAPRPEAETDAARLRETARRLDEKRPADGAFAPTVTESFALRSAQTIDQLRNAIADHSAENAQRAAAALRASADFLGATRLARMARAIAPTAAAADWAQAMTQLTAIEHEHQVVLTLLFEANK